MARNKGTFNFAANFEALVKSPLDAKTLVDFYTDLVNPTTWADADGNVWLYNGMMVGVSADSSLNNGLYWLNDADNYTSYSGWSKLSNVGDVSTGAYVLKSGDTMTGPLVIDSSLIVMGNIGVGLYNPEYTVDISGNLRVSDETVAGQSYIENGLIVNNSQGDASLNNFIVYSRDYTAINVDASNNAVTIVNNILGKLGFFGAEPSAQSTGWDASDGSGDKQYVVTATTITELADVLGSLINELINKGLIGGI